MYALYWMDVNDAHGFLQSLYFLWKSLRENLKLIWMFHKQRRNLLADGCACKSEAAQVRHMDTCWHG